MADRPTVYCGRYCFYKTILWTSSLLFLCFDSNGAAESFTRNVTAQLNPGSHGTTRGDLLHIRAVGGNDTLHFLFCSQGAPTLLLVHTNTSTSTVSVNWTQFESLNASGSFKVEPENSVLYSCGLVFSRLLEYDDVNNTAQVTPDLFPPYDLSNVSWSRISLSDMTALLCGEINNGSLCVQLSYFQTEGRGQNWPRLLHTANTSQLAMWLDGVLPRAPRSRFLLELQAVGGQQPLSQVEVERSIDDEFTPSIFKVAQWVSKEDKDVLGFVQWKPVAYRHTSPALEDATPCRHSDPERQSAEAAESSSSLIQAFYTENEATYGLNVSFGLAGDPFYNSTLYLSWTMLVGVGPPPSDGLSPLVLAIVAVGLGAPLVLLLVGGISVCLRKKVTSSSTLYEPIN
ncbi:glycosylated lysosomal membrane protein isoform X1 [Synchiropus splendidus]|uniref:glycosylated lysosomal membrane protein isoform X1 n=1 Tax=Synchiropus splendidus TaxID=270530 RepID=UPI00237E133F|nr:glycosylated lysosomal membrane protein isoform X1 [Synchiropus splendidus]